MIPSRQPMFRIPMSALCLLFVVPFALNGCNGKKGLQQQPENSDNELSERDPKSGGIADTIRNQKDMGNKFDEPEPLPDDLNELMSFLAQKQTEQLRTRDDAENYKIQQQRAEASGKLLGMNVNAEQRFEFLRIRVDALLKLISAGDPKAKIDFQKLITAYGKHRQPRLRQVVAIGGLIYDFRQAIVLSANEPESAVTQRMAPVIDAASKIVNEYPASFDVCKEIGTIADQLLQQGHRDAWSELSDVLVEGYRDSENETCRNFSQRTAGRLKAASANLDLIVEEMRQRIPDASEKYRQAVNYLLSDVNINLASLQPIVGSLQWLENTGMHDESLEANRIVLTASLQITNQAVRDQLRAHCEKRQTRLGWIGKDFAISALASDNQVLDWNAFANDKPAMVVFWSPSEPASVKFVQHLAGIFDEHKQHGLKLLAVSLVNDPKLSERFAREGDRPRQWEIASGPVGTDGPCEFIDAYGIANVPQLILVDRDGTVSDVNPVSNQLKAKIQALLK